MISDLLIAAERGALDKIVAAMGRGASLAEANADGETALALAAKHGHSACVQALATARGVKVVDRWGRTPLMLAAIGGHLECLEVILAKMEPASALAKDFDGRSALMLAARHGHLMCAQALAPHSRASDCDLRGLDALAIARKLGHSEVALWLGRQATASGEALAQHRPALGM